MPSFHRQHPYPSPDYVAPFGHNYGQKSTGYGYEHGYEQPATKGADPYLAQQYSRDQGQFMTLPGANHHYAGNPPPGLAHPGAMNFQYSLPPPQVMQPCDDSLARVDHTRVQQQSQPKPSQEESRPVGGVAATLDYDMDDMVDFVAQMTTGIVEKYSEGVHVSSAFRKFVYQMLSSTRLPSATILLGMGYLSTRCSTEGVNACGSQRKEVYRMLTMALLLASKFLDDNTFQNRSWAEVTGIPVLELNQMEVDWLTGMDWRLHTQPDAPKGFFRWQSVWLNWTKSRDTKRNLEHTPLPPIVTHSAALPSLKTSFSPPQALYPPHNIQAIGYPSSAVNERSRSIDQGAFWWPNPGLTTPGANNSPSAPETGPTTPDQFGRWDLHFASQGGRPRHMGQQPQVTYPTYHPQSLQSQNPYAQHSSALQQQHVWGCSCAQCQAPRHHESYFMNTYARPGPLVVS